MSERRDLLRESVAAIERLQARLEVSERAIHQPIAIIGAGCRFPGGVETPQELWRVLRDGVDAVSDVPADRWDVDAYDDEDSTIPGKMVSQRGGFLAQVDSFDPQFFGISPREATAMDPQQRLLLETAYEALESAGLACDSLKGSATGVFVGITTSDYGQLVRAGGPESSDIYTATGTALNAAAGRLSFTFDFRGPCMAVDAACASSLVAVHLACQSLRTGESDLALAGGVNVILSPDAAAMFSKWGMMAPDGACKTFDAAADGFVRGEGCAVIALKRLSDARVAGDPILAVIRGSAVNSDGRSSGLTVPNGPAQEMVLKKALASAVLTPVDIDYVEAHGTGTSLGDPIEVEALGAVMCQGRPADRPLRIGSVKTNLGHTEAAAGLAGLLKVIMALRHEFIPPHLHFSKPNPAIPWEQFPITVPTTLTPWPRGERPRRAGVSSFGFSGINAHVIVEEAPPTPASPAVEESTPLLVPLSAHDDAALRDVAQQLAEALCVDTAPTLADVATTAATGRSHLTRRLALLAESSSELQGDLRLFAAGQLPAGAAEGTIRAGQRPKIAFLFTGQGSQYAGMGRKLYDTEPVFRNALDQAAAILEPHLRRPLLESMFAKEAERGILTQTELAQPALFAIEYALVQLWRSWGITPSIVLGHSVGEFVAACVAGVFSLEDGLTLIAERGRLMQELPAGGAMAAVFADEARVRARLAKFADRLAVAALNGREETVISGDAAALTALLAHFSDDGIKSSMLEVSHAFHSPRLDPMLDALERRARDVQYAAPRIRLLSNLTGAPFPAGTFPDAHYWRRHAREPVQFAACVDALRAEGVTMLVEVGPHPTLLALAGRAAPDASWSAVASLRKGRDDRREMLSGLAKLYVCGSAVQWESLARGRRVALPTYPFRRERYWAVAGEGKMRLAQPRHLLGERGELASGTRNDDPNAEVPGVPHDWYYEVRWRAQSRSGARVRGAKAGPWLIFADRGGIAERIAARQKAMGIETILVTPGDHWSFADGQPCIRPGEPGDYKRLFESVGKPAVVIHLWSIDTPEDPSMKQSFAVGSGSLLCLLHGLLGAEGSPQPRLWLVTRDAQAVVAGDRCDSPWNATLWGLGRTLSVENSEIWGGLVDLAGSSSIEPIADQLIAEITEGTLDDKIALRGGDRYVARLARRRASRRTPGDFVPRPDGTYLITGGLGGIGLAIARWLVQHGAKHLLLVGRTPLRAGDIGVTDHDSLEGRRAAAVAALVSLGAEVETAAIDVAVEGALEGCLERRRVRGAPPVCGVFHTAGTVQFQPLATQDIASLRGGLAAKVDGAWRLHRLFAGAPLDCFVLFSSTSALLNSPLLGGYAAGNAFLDALAHHRRARGLPALSINWGTWGEVGMAVEAGRGGAMLKGVGLITTSRGLAALRELLQAGDTQAAVMPVDWTEFARAYPAFTADPFLEAMVSDVGHDQRLVSAGLSVAAFQGGSPDQRLVMVGGYLREQAARVLGMRLERLDDQLPLSSYGFDSLMAVQLKNRIEADLGIIVPLIQFLQGPSVGELIPSMFEELEKKSAAPESQNARVDIWEEGVL